MRITLFGRAAHALAGLALVTGPITPAFAAPAKASAAAPAGASLPELVSRIDIPHETFTLPNGLRVIVHTDRKAPIVAVSVWYHVGSKDEPAGKTGFAHLFEHLMFNGSENADGDYFDPLKRIGATDLNGTTWFDRTNYYQTVPTGALETALFLESDRMGWLLKAVTQEKLDNQRGVVQNEKRQGDNQPYGLVEYAQLEALFPEGHPYRHSTIGSMADLDAASLDDVKQWFRDKYGPNNAVLVLSGDVDVATAKQLVAKYFGNIPRGPAVSPAMAEVPTLAAPKSETMTDKVATVRLYRNWAVPGLTSPDIVPLDMFAAVLGGLASSRLDNQLVKGEKVAVSVSASVQPFERVGQFEVVANVKPGVDPALVGQRVDAIIAELLAKGPTADEVQRVAMREITGRVNALESVNAKASMLAEGALYARDPDFHKKQLAQYAAATPAQIRDVARKWLSRPAYALSVVPGERAAYVEAKGSAPAQKPRHYRAPEPNAAVPAPSGGVDRSKFPTVGQIDDLDFPTVRHAQLGNGIKLRYVQRPGAPLTKIAISFDAGTASDSKAKLGLHALGLALLDEGTTSRGSIAIAEEQERLGASIGTGSSMDRASVSLSALTPNLAPSLDLLADIVRNPAFDPAEIERVRGQMLTRIQSEMTDPSSIASRAMGPILYGEAHPYGIPLTGSGTAETVKGISRADLVAFHQRWIRPDTAEIFVVSDAPLEQIQPLLDARFGNWTAVGTKGVKNLAAPVSPANPRIVLIDRPGSPQSLIYGGQLLGFDGTRDTLDIATANEILGGDFLSRINMDLRETKGWAYGAGGGINRMLGRVPYLVRAPVQADKTGPSIAAIQEQMNLFLTSKGITADELDRTITGNIRELPGSFASAGSVLGAMMSNAAYGRPDDYYEHLAARYRAFTAAQLDQAARDTIDPSKFVWVVVGDAAKVKPQLDALGLPVETMEVR